MPRFLFWLLFGIAAWMLVKRVRESKAPPAIRPPGARPVENMVACAQCGLLLPESESIKNGGAHYCCREHLKKQ